MAGERRDWGGSRRSRRVSHWRGRREWPAGKESRPCGKEYGGRGRWRDGEGGRESQRRKETGDGSCRLDHTVEYNKGKLE